MKTVSRLVKRLYSFHWFLDTWTVKQKWTYVALYVVFFRLGLIPILVISETTGLLSEGTFLSLCVLAILLLLWFAVYQPVVNLIFARDGN